MRKLLLIVMLLVMIPLIPHHLSGAEAQADTGTCGTNVKYEISGNTINFSKEDPGSTAYWGDCGSTFERNSAVTVVNVNDTIKAPENCSFKSYHYVQKMNLSKLDVSDVTDMNYMFGWCDSLTDLDVRGWNTSNVTNMESMFYECSSLTSLDVRGWDTSNVTNMYWMFHGCSSLLSLDVSGWNTSNVTNMAAMFYECSSLTSLDVSGWDTSKVEDMRGMFYECSSLTSLDLSGWNTSKVYDVYVMFYECSSLHRITLGKNSLETNLFKYLPAYNQTWYYAAQGADAEQPLPLNTEKADATLFTEYDYKTMAGTWDTELSSAPTNTPTPTPTPTPEGSVQPGDLNGDGVIDIRDPMRLVKILNKEAVEVFCSSDLNGDGTTDIRDLMRLVKYLNKESVELK